MKRGLLTLAAAAMMLAPIVPATAQARVIVTRPIYYGGWYRPYWGSYWGWGPGYMGPYYVNPTAGEVKIDTKVKDAQVFIDGAYAGTTKQNKSMYLRQGNYNIEIREAGRTAYAEKVYVVAGKTLKLRPEL
jgi:hypothetical protein